jgi:hypothetical protein
MLSYPIKAERTSSIWSNMIKYKKPVTYSLKNQHNWKKKKMWIFHKFTRTLNLATTKVMWEDFKCLGNRGLKFRV